jgi:flagellin-like protein
MAYNYRIDMTYLILDGFNERGRKGVSPVLATVILLSITLVAAGSMAAYLFGLFTPYTSGTAFSGFLTTSSGAASTGSSGPVSAVATSCSNSGAKLSCSIDMTNSGTSSITIVKNTCQVFVDGTYVTGTNSAKTVKAGKSATGLTCKISGAEPPVGSAASGILPTTDGEMVPFYGTWS